MAMTAMQHRSFTIEIKHQACDSYKILEQMQKERVLCDVTLVAHDVEIAAHKTILASCSPYFYSMFTNFQTAKQERIQLDINPRVLLSVVNYMYTSKLIVLEQNIMDLLEVSKMLLLNRVQLECCNILKRMLNCNNCLGIKAVAAKYGQVDLLDSTLSYIDDNFIDVVASEEFISLTSDEISELISKDNLKVSSEEKVYECIVRWINHDPKGRRKYLRLLIGYVRFRFISKNYLRQHIIEDSFLRGDTFCKDLVLKAILEEDETAILKTKCRRYEKNRKVLLVIGGSRKAGKYYNFEKKRWSNIVEMPFNMNGTSLAVINQKVYVTGILRNNSSVRKISCYDINTNNWEEINDMTIATGTHAAAVVNNCIYVLGGSAGGFWTGSLNTAEKFDFETRKWSSIASMLRERSLFGVGVLNDILYALGGDGCTLRDAALKSVECYNHRTDTWKKLSSMNHPRWGLGVCTLDGKLYAIGGHNGRQCLSTIEEYNPYTDSWTEITPMKIARCFPGVAVADNKIYVTGGYDGNSYLNSTEVYDKFTNSWTFLSESMNVARSGHGAVIIDKTS